MLGFSRRGCQAWRCSPHFKRTDHHAIPASSLAVCHEREWRLRCFGRVKTEIKPVNTWWRVHVNRYLIGIRNDFTRNPEQGGIKGFRDSIYPTLLPGLGIQ